MPGQVKRVRRPPNNWWTRSYIPAILQGLWITSRHFFRNLFLHITHRLGLLRHRRAGVVYQWPEELRPVYPRYRGLHRLLRRPDGSPRCVACYMCETICPAECIHIIAKEVDDPLVEKAPEAFFIDLSRCIFCGYCVEACPEDAIRMDVFEFRIASYDRFQMVLDMETMLNLQPSVPFELAEAQPMRHPNREGGAGGDDHLTSTHGIGRAHTENPLDKTETAYGGSTARGTGRSGGLH